MRNKIWKKGISITLAAMMMTGTISVPVMQGRSTVSIVKAEEKTMPESPSVIDGYVYATVDMEYADYYYGEVNKITDVTSLDLSKGDIVDNTYTKGEYDAVTSATTEKSQQYATTYFDVGVANDETDGAATGVTTYGVKDVEIAIPENLYKELKAQENNENYKDLSVYKYLKNATYSDTAFEEYKELNGDGTFKATKSPNAIVKDASSVEGAATITSSSQYGNWQVDLNKPFYPDYISPRSMQGVIIETSDGAKYGMLHGDNLWVNTGEMAFVAQEWQVHGQNHIAYAHTSDLSGKTIVKITYLLKQADAYTEGAGGRHETNYPACDGTDIVFTNLNLYCKKVSDTKVSAQDVNYNAAGTKVKFNFENTPADADFKVNTVKKGSGRGAQELSADSYQYDASTGILTLNENCTADVYTVSFVSDKYTDVSASFEVLEKNPEAQTITTSKDSYTVTYGAKAFNLGAKANTPISYASSNTKVATVDAKGKVTIKGAGSATITLKAAGTEDYTEASKTVKITVNKAKATITTTAKSTVSKAYGAKAFSLGAKATSGTTLKYKSSSTKVVTVSSKGVVTIKGTGTATITVTASGANYNTATKKITVKVSPKKQTVKLKAGKKKVAIQWKKDTKATGYQIKIGTKKNLSGAKTYTVKSYKTYKKTVSKLKSKKKYYVKVRAYKTVGKTKLYGAYSSVKSVKVK